MQLCNIKKKQTNKHNQQVFMFQLKILSHSKQKNESKAFVLATAQVAFWALYSKLEMHLDQTSFYIRSKI